MVVQRDQTLSAATEANPADRLTICFPITRILREHQATQAQLVEKLVSGKLNKQQFLDQETVVAKKMEETSDKIRSIVSLLR